MKEVSAPNGGILILAEKGESGNPNGRPKGVKSFKRIMKELLKTQVTTEDLQGVFVQLTAKEAATLLLVKDSINEKLEASIRMKALNMVMEKIDGKAIAKADIKHSGNIGTNIDPSKLSIQELELLVELSEKAKRE